MLSVVDSYVIEPVWYEFKLSLEMLDCTYWWWQTQLYISPHNPLIVYGTNLKEINS